MSETAQVQQKKGNISLTTVVIISSILLIAGTALTITAINLLSASRAKSNYYSAEARAKTCIQESLGRIRDLNSYTGSLSLSFPDGSSCNADVVNQADPNIKDITITASSNEYTYQTVKTVNALGLTNGYNSSASSLGDVLAATTQPSSITWYQPFGTTNASDDKNTAYNMAHSSSGFSKGAAVSSSYYTLLSYTGNNQASGYMDYKISSTGLSSLYVSATSINQSGDGVSRTSSILYSTDGGATYTQLASTSFSNTATSGTNINGTITFANTIGGSVIVRLVMSGTVGTDQIGFSSITFTPTATSFDFVPRISNFEVQPNIPTTSLGSVATSTAPGGLAIQGNFAYITNYTTNLLQTFDISSRVPVTKTSISTGTGPKAVVTNGKYAFTANYTANTFSILDITNPGSTSAPFAAIATGTSPSTLAISGKYLYVGNEGSNSFQIFDISVPSSPVQVTTSTGIAMGGPVKSMLIQGNYLYLVIGTTNTLKVYNISDPYSPVSVSSTALASSAPDNLYVVGKYLYMSMNSNRVYIYDITTGTPANLSGASGYTLSTATTINNIFVQGKYAYISRTGSDGIDILDVSYPSSPKLYGSISTGSSTNPNKLFIQGNTLYVINNSANTFVSYDIGGSYFSTLEAGGINSTNLNVSNNLNAAQGYFSHGLDVGHSLFAYGSIGTNSFYSFGGAIGYSGTSSTNKGFLFDQQLRFKQASGDDTNAGVIDYKNLDSTALSIVGYGTTSSTTKNVRIYDRLSVNAANAGYNLYINGTSYHNGATTLIGTLNQSGGDFQINDAGTVDSTAVRILSSSGNLYLQNGSGNSIIFRSKTATNNAAITDAGNMTIIGSITIDSDGTGTGASSSEGLYFGGTSSGSYIVSKRTAGGNQNGLDLFTNNTSRISIDSTGLITTSGNIRIGTGITCLASVCPTNSILHTSSNNVYLNSATGNFFAVNYETGFVTGTTIQFKVGTGAGADAMYVRADGQAYSYGWNSLSSIRYKTGVKEFHYGLVDLMKLNPKEYVYKTQPNNPQVGLIAEEVIQSYPEAVTFNDKGEPEAIDYSKFAPLLIQSIKDQQKTIDDLKKSLDPSNPSVHYWTVNGDTLATTYNIDTTKGVTAESVNVKGALTALSISATCGTSELQNDCSAIAQKYNSSELTEEGDIVEIDINQTKKVKKSSKQSKLMIGVVTKNAATVLGLDGKIQNGGDTSSFITANTTIVGFAGQTPVKVNLENGDIKVGDAITSSSKPGEGMKAKAGDPVIGIALENASINKKILILLSKTTN